MEGKKWQEWLTSIGTVIALILGGVTFYYQFVRKTRELRAVVLPLDWGGRDTLTARLAIWNDGSRDEVVESGSLIAQYGGPSNVTSRKRLLGPEVIKPGEAKAFTVTVGLDTAESYGRLQSSVSREVPSKKAQKLNLILELKTIDRAGDVIVHRVEMGQMSTDGDVFNTMAGGHGTKRLNLLETRWVGERHTTVMEER